MNVPVLFHICVAKSERFVSEWKKFAILVGKYQIQFTSSRSTLAFDFVEVRLG